MHRRLIVSSVFAALLLFDLRAGAQETFDVAVVKTSTLRDVIVPGVFLPGGRWSAEGATLSLLVRMAYELPADRVVGLSELPAWTRSERFHVDAKAADPNTPLERLRAMAQQLLADRFGLRAHVEQQVTKVYALVIDDATGRLGKGLRPAAATCWPKDAAVHTSAACQGVISKTSGGAMRYQLRDRRLADLLILSGARSEVDYPIVDRTGLVGRFDIDVEFVYRADSPQPDIQVGLPFMLAMKEQLGIRLELRDERLDVLIIDGIARPALD